MNNLLACISGGRTSGYMGIKIKAHAKSDTNIHYVYANTGFEHEKTLEFIEKIDKEYNLGVVWVEAVVYQDEYKGTGYKIVDFESASRRCEPFIEVIKKYGIPNKAYPHCNRELKLAPIHSYMADKLNGEPYKTAIGIRPDESRRVSPRAAEAHNGGIIYPLIDIFPADKIDILDFWDDQPFDLGIPEHYGNCKTCWKKSDRKLWTIAVEHPEWFEFNSEMERLYKHAGHNDGERPRSFFRRNRTTQDIFNEVEALNFKAFKESRDTQLKLFGYDIDEDSGCSESCEMFDMEDI